MNLRRTRRGLVMNKQTVIVDIDGTLADISHRERHVKGKRKRWGKFFQNMDKDLPIPEVAAKVRQLSLDHTIILVSGRPDEYRAVTEEWLKRHKIPYQDLYMRKSGDFRPDDVVKQEILKTRLKKEEIKLVIDDRPRVIRMWRKNGLEVEDVGNGIEF
jgi:phosphoglycolate phosphatase-like HAD superfamily hydrolase